MLKLHKSHNKYQYNFILYNKDCIQSGKSDIKFCCITVSPRLIVHIMVYGRLVY